MLHHNYMNVPSGEQAVDQGDVSGPLASDGAARSHGQSPGKTNWHSVFYVIVF
jgi:hypothetical protein